MSAFFARLGYNADARTTQTPGNLGITADGTTRQISRIELIADQESLFQVYLFELKSVTVAVTRAIARAFRNRAGNYLLVLTSDYDYLDFVLLEKYLPSAQDRESTIAQKQIGIRPRVLTVERRKPTKVQLRVLRRLTWTEVDPFAQYDKLISAYTIADWSEEFFNNRALFSDYYLTERLPSSPIWLEDPKPTYKRLLELYHGASSRLGGKPEALARKELLEPVLRELGFELRVGKEAGSREAKHDFALYSGNRNDPPLAFCLVYPWGRSLDGKDDLRDKESSDENPAQVVVSLLENADASWVIVTNGKLWRLYSKRTHSRSTNYYEIDLEEVLAQTGSSAMDPANSFRYFWLLFRRQSFEPATVIREGKENWLSFLDVLLVESEDYAKELGEQLKERVFEEVFPYLAAGFIEHIRKNRESPGEISSELLDRVFKGTLTLLYRLLFLLYAESRDLLPVKETRGYFDVSLTKLKHQTAIAAENIVDEVPEKLKRRYGTDSYALYGDLAELFKTIDRGNAALNVPFYNGGLFLSDPDPGDDTPEAEAARFLTETRVSDQHLSLALDLLSRAEDNKTHALAFIDYRSLGVRQLGSIYEGLLEFKLYIAEMKLAVVSEKGREVYVEFKELDQTKRDKAERLGGIVKKGEIYLENDKRERKATGSYYTPDYIVKYIVEQTVGPVIEEKFEAMRPVFREAQKWHKDAIIAARARKESPAKYEFGPAVETRWQSLIDDFFDIKVLDPSMGSGHFLVEAVDFITDKALAFLNAFPWNPVLAYLASTRETILQEMESQGITIDPKRLDDVNLLKRHVLKRCIYGVDLNHMAVELAKVSLWLDCFTLGAPLSFLDHHLRCGNSLIGVSVEETRQAIESVTTVRTKSKVAASATEWKTVASTSHQFDLFGGKFARLLKATELMRHVGEMTDVTSSQLKQSHSEYRKASGALAPFKRILDIYTSQWFGNGTKKQKGRSESIAVEFLKSSEAEQVINANDQRELYRALDGLSEGDRQIIETALVAAQKKRFFHWELEFPEVFYGHRNEGEAIERLHEGGFDAVVGNPPYDVLEKERGMEEWPHEELLEFIKEYLRYKPCLGGKLNLYRPFVVLGLFLTRNAGWYSQIIPMSFMGDLSLANTRRHAVLENALSSISAFPQKDDPRRRVFREAKLSTCIPVIKSCRVDLEEHFVLRTYPANSFGDTPLECSPTPGELMAIDPEHLPFPLCNEEELRLAVKIHNVSKRLVDVSKITRGEVNQTVFRRYITEDPGNKPLLKGVEIRRFGFNEKLSQGKREYFDERSYERDHLPKRPPRERIALQRITGVDEVNRLIAATSRNGAYFADSTNSLISGDGQLTALIVGLLNSKLLNWRFMLTSTNNNVGTNELEVLPFPKELPQRKIDRLKEIVQGLGRIERKEMKDGEGLALLDKLDSSIYEIYELTHQQIAIIERRWNS